MASRSPCNKVSAYFDKATGRVVRSDGRRVHVSPQEAILLDLLWTHANELVTKESVYEAIYWREDEGPSLKIIDVYLCHLRKHLAGTDIEIKTVWGVGYKLKTVTSNRDYRFIQTCFEHRTTIEKMLRQMALQSERQQEKELYG